MASRTPSSGRRPDYVYRDRTRLILIIALGGLAALTILLSYAALTQNRSVEGSGTTPISAAPPAEEESRETPAESPAPDPVVTVADTARVLAAVDADLAYRAVTGACPATPATIEVTADAGGEWIAYEASDIAASRSIRSISPGGGGFVSMITLNADSCAPQYLHSFVEGIAWEAAEGLTGEWFVDPANAALLNTPVGAATAPCEVVRLAPRDDVSAAALCRDSSLALTADAGASWSRSAPITGADALSATGDGYRLAVIGQNGCANAQVMSVGNGLELGAPGACVAGTGAAGQTALAEAGDGTVWLWSGDALMRSADGGASWL